MRRFKRYYLESFFLSILLCTASCNTTEPPDPPITPQLKATLILQDVSCLEAWIKLELENIELPVNVSLAKDSIQILQINNLKSNDTVVYVDSLLPNRTYSFQVSSIPQSGGQNPVSSNELKVTTLDTTSHNFSYTVYEFGNVSSSILYDVAIVGEEIWAVGEIYMDDSLGNTIRYNAVHWNGNEWTIIRIPYLYQGQPYYHPIQSVYSFGENDIWFCGNGVIHWDGNNYVPISIPSNVWGPYQMNKLWGTSSNDLYVIGNEGNIAHYNGSQWSRVESGTDLHLTDIYGRNENEVYATGANISDVKGVLLKGNNNQFSVMINSEIIDESELFEKLYGILAAVWLDENNTIYTGGNLLYQYKNGSWDYVRSLPENYIGGNPGSFYRGFISSIRGNSSNDYIIAGGRNTLRHFNGYTWEQLGLPYDPASPIVWRNLSIKNNTVVTAGFNNNKAIIMVLKR